MTDPRQVRTFSPPSIGWRRSSWSGGAFDSARRAFASEVEGNICIPHHLVLVTLRGGARQVEVQMDCGHRFAGMDRAGLVSFVPAGCQRSLKLRDVETEWASISLDPDVFGGSDWTPFTNRPDRLIAELAAELTAAQRIDGTIDPMLLEGASLIIARRLGRSAGSNHPADRVTPLSGRMLRRINEFIDANIAAPISIADLAALAEMSPSHFHRCFRKATGETPLSFVTRRRIEAAVRIIEEGRLPISELALSVGFASSGHFARCFRRYVGRSPSEFARNWWQDRAAVSRIRRALAARAW